MKYRSIVIISLLLCTILAGCQKNLIKDPTINEKTPEITATTAVFEWTVDFPGKISSMVEIGLNEDMSDATRYGSDAETTEAEFKVLVTGLDESTRYFYRYIVWNPNIHFESNVKRFFTLTIYDPTVITTPLTDVTNNSAVGGGEVTNDGNAEITERGLCWSTNHNPEITDSHVSNGSGLGSFTIGITGLKEGTLYYVRAYAVNSKGVSYGEEMSVITSLTGAVKDVFSVSPNEKVYFSKGNLQYQASSNTWRFAEHQYECLGNDNCDISSSNSGWIDLFGWGTSGWESGASCYQPWSASIFDSDYLPGELNISNLTGDYANADWGVYNAISNGGNQAGIWRTLTKDEWIYVLEKRKTTSGIRYAKAIVNDINGVILFPDNWDESYYALTFPNSDSFLYSINVVSSEQWIALEQHGAVFLPSAGFRLNDNVRDFNADGYYWSVSYFENSNAYCLFFDNAHVKTQDDLFCPWGASVRLVHSVQ